ncbi:MAG: hypothetical protein MUP52_03415, partial [Candidatus Aminicenantes bacterium]|nr:hypothetical protein [Candidatus Aminicenantes bacterium]
MNHKLKEKQNCAGMALLVAAAVSMLSGAGVAQDFSKYHTYAEMTEIVQNLANANKTLVKLESIGKT